MKNKLTDAEKDFIKTMSIEDKIKTIISYIDTPIGRRRYPEEVVLTVIALAEDFGIRNPPALDF